MSFAKTIENLPEERREEYIAKFSSLFKVKYEEMVEKLLAHIKNQDIKLGAKTTRGLGAISIEKCGKKVFPHRLWKCR